MAEDFKPMNRSAEAAIRGYVYQVDVTIERWLKLDPNEYLELECGEDIDHIFENGRTTVQVKDVKSNTLTLLSGLESIINFVKNCKANPSQNLYFLYITTASVGKERNLPPIFRGQPSIEIWEQIRQDCLGDIPQNEALIGIRDVLCNSQKYEEKANQNVLRDYICNANNDDLLKIVHRFQWLYENLSSDSIGHQIIQMLMKKYDLIEEVKAKELYNRLFIYVFKALTRSGVKRLTIDNLTEQIECPKLSCEDESLLELVNQVNIRVSKLEEDVYDLGGRVSNLEKGNGKYDDNLISQPERLEKRKLLCRQHFIESLRVFVDDDTAIKLANDSSIWTPLSELNLRYGEVNFLVGDIGIGKTAIALRIYQEALEKFEIDKDAPIPVFLESGAWCQDKYIKTSIENAIYGWGNPEERGVIAILDGFDQVGVEITSDIPRQANLLVVDWDKTTIIITSRSIRLLDNIENKIHIPQLSEKQSYELIAKASGLAMTAMICSGWTLAIQEAIRYPLFALIMASYLKQDLVNSPQSTGELLSWLVDDALRRSKVEYVNYESLLQQLALQSIENGGQGIRATDIAKSNQIKLLLDSGLVVARSRDVISFPLQILDEWFAAKSLEDNPEKVREFANNPQQLEKWRFSLTIAVATFRFDIVSKMLQPIVEIFPAFVVELVIRASTRWGRKERQLPTFYKCGQQIQTAMQLWAKGLMHLAEIAIPIQNDGKVCPIGVKTDGIRLETAWYVGTDLLDEDVVELPEEWDDDFYSKRLNWRNGTSSDPSDESAWAWRWTINVIFRNLSDRLKYPILPVDSQPLIKEAAWRCALAIIEYRRRKRITKIKLNWWGIEHFSIEEIIETVFEIEQAALQNIDITLSDISDLVDINVQAYFLKQLKIEIYYLLEKNETIMHSMYPVPDIDGGKRLWQLYSNAQLSLRVKMVYKNALDAYQEITHTWFNQLIPNMQVSAMLPARLVGIIIMPLPDRSLLDMPYLDWFLEPLSKNSENEVEITFIERGADRTNYDNRRELASNKIKLLRSKYAVWISNYWHKDALDDDFFLHSPATKLAYSWLQKDLVKIFGFNTFPRETKTS
ncbi:MAG: hypothetical protein DCF19_03140 [Pseudanabaena frigida]|uniref:Uncharacterized protein n=1 Tax=Pseudanabaena frigida TaxID=945775 RepID=A0A2W4WQT4_9CYAN|nr:MAG: hypothetical protein DCF19_03140 [Pseudanabaena frigida]